jgi:hypothetical protein
MLPDNRQPKAITFSKDTQASSVFLVDDKSFVDKHKYGVLVE